MRLKERTSIDSTSLAAFTEKGLIVPQLVERDAAGVIKELTQCLHEQGWVKDSLPFYNAALTREFLSSTSSGTGIAFPHAHAAGLAHPRFALGKSALPFPWGVPRSTQVQFVFLVAAPVQDDSVYLPLLSGLAKLARNENLLQELRQAVTALEILAVLDQVKLRPTGE